MDKRIVKIFTVLVVAFSMFICVNIWAEDDIRIALTKDKIQPGKQTTLQIIVNKTGNISIPEIPYVEGLEIKYQETLKTPDTVNAVGGPTSYLFKVVALKEGAFTIGPVTVELEGRRISSGTALLTVERELTTQRSVSEASLFDLSKHIYVTSEISKKVVYVNEKITLSVTLHSDWLDLENISLWQDVSDNFIAEKFKETGTTVNQKDQTKFVELKYAATLFALTPGAYSINPVTIKFTVSKPKPGLTGELLNNNATEYEGFIGPTGARESELVTIPGVINVRQLPDAGRPESFSGAVGDFTFDVGIDKKNIKIPDTLKLTMTVGGKGNLDTVKMPAVPEGEGVKVYEPKKTNTGDKLIYEYTMRINTPDYLRIPAITFSYFNPDKDEYLSVTKGDIPLSIEGAQKVITPLTDNVKRLTKKEETKILDIKESPGIFLVSGGNNISALASVIFLAIIPMVAIAGGIVIRRRLIMLEANPSYAALLKASGRARKGIKNARDLAQLAKSAEFYAMIFKILQEYFAIRLNTPSGGITAQVTKKLKSNGMEDSLLKRIESVFEVCHSSRFSGSIPDTGNRMATILKETQYVIEELNKKPVI